MKPDGLGVSVSEHRKIYLVLIGRLVDVGLQWNLVYLNHTVDILFVEVIRVSDK